MVENGGPCSFTSIRLSIHVYYIGLDFIAAEYWPKAIHEGNITAQYFITNKANEEQRHALIVRYSLVLSNISLNLSSSISRSI
jgi:hypothetical protein